MRDRPHTARCGSVETCAPISGLRCGRIDALPPGPHDRAVPAQDDQLYLNDGGVEKMITAGNAGFKFRGAMVYRAADVALDADPGLAAWWWDTVSYDTQNDNGLPKCWLGTR